MKIKNGVGAFDRPAGHTLCLVSGLPVVGVEGRSCPLASADPWHHRLIFMYRLLSFSCSVMRGLLFVYCSVMHRLLSAECSVMYRLYRLFFLEGEFTDVGSTLL